MTAVDRKPRAKEQQTHGLAANIRRLRHARDLTLDELASRSGVSRAMISKIERNVAVPTATVLGKLALGLEVGLSRLIGEQSERRPTMLSPEAQAVYHDPETGFIRTSLSPSFPDRRVEFAFNVLPPRQSAVFPPHPPGVEEYLFVSKGSLVVMACEERFDVRQGCSLFYRGDMQHEFRNETDQPAEFYVVVDGNGAA